eukprot:3579136-Prymnesium_polylepis.4
MRRTPLYDATWKAYGKPGRSPPRRKRLPEVPLVSMVTSTPIVWSAAEPEHVQSRYGYSGRDVVAHEKYSIAHQPTPATTSQGAATSRRARAQVARRGLHS